MISCIEKLVSISSDSICQDSSRCLAEILGVQGVLIDELENLLRKKNGFYVFESALHVFPKDCYPQSVDLVFWNQALSWKNHYYDALNSILFFAEDLFGEQFGISEGQIIRFNPETGETVSFSRNLEEWATKILDDYAFETGYELAAEWQKQNGPIPIGSRLLPITPFFLGGKFEINNLYAINAVEGMKYRAGIWKQTKDIPDGTEVELRVVE